MFKRAPRTPTTRGHALQARAVNFPTLVSDTEAFSSVPISAVAAWRYYRRNCGSRFKWSQSILTPRAALVHMRDGPVYFSRQWELIFMREIVFCSLLFSSLPTAILRRIIECAK